MNILYGVQATGQGHISRARAVAAALSGHGNVRVTWLFSGRDVSRLFDMEPFGHFEHRPGLSFAYRDGRIDYLATLRQNRLLQFVRDVRGLDLPALATENQGHILVYLPFEDQDAVTRLLGSFPSRRFIQYANGLEPVNAGNVDRRPASISGFKKALACCDRVICNSGFELISECLHWGKPVLTRPLAGQTEQESNALALQQLGYATVMQTLSVGAIESWLGVPRLAPVRGFADVARAVADWLAGGARVSPAELGRQLWQGHGWHSRVPGATDSRPDESDASQSSPCPASAAGLKNLH